MRYPVLPKEDSRKVRDAIRRVFIEVWDPIGVMADPTWPRDEYDGYIGRTFELLTSGGTDEQLMEHLLWTVERIGMDASRVSLETVIAALRAIEWNSQGSKDENA